MENIAHLLKLLNTFQEYSFLFKTSIEPLLLMKAVPNNILLILNNPEFLLSIQEAITSLEQSFLYLDNFKNDIKKASKHSTYSPKQVPYADYSVDQPPIIKQVPTHNNRSVTFGSFKQLIDEKSIKPINRKYNSPFNFTGVCPFCGAPHKYIYDNNGRGQLKCKVCENTFKKEGKIYNHKDVPFYCPHCNSKLHMKHDRDGYKVFSCNNKKCSFYLSNLKEASDNPDKFATSSKGLKLHYYFREFKFSLKDLDYYCESKVTKVNLANKYFDDYTLGLVLTYRINYGLSARKTAAILRDIHGIKISHQTIMNYSNATATLIKTFVDTYPYKLGDTLTADETYVTVKGKHNYVFFFSDPESKIITSYNIFDRRSTEEACKSIYFSLCKYSTIPNDLLLVTDANPIYNAAQVFFKLNGYNFELRQVVGLSNNDFDSWYFRPLKQIEERLNRTFKSNYDSMNGFSNLEKANSYMILFVAFFNFLRVHKGLNYKCPVEDNLFDTEDLMPFKWLKLIEYSMKLSA